MAISARTQQALTEVSGLLAQYLVVKAFEQLHGLIAKLPPGELILAAEEVKALIAQFHKQKKRQLTDALERRLRQTSSIRVTNSTQAREIVNPLSPRAATRPLSERVAHALQVLATEFIFRWTPHYRDNLKLIFTWALAELPKSGQLDAEVRAIGAAFGSHATRIFKQGYKFQISRGLKSDVAEEKSVNGLQKFGLLPVSKTPC